MCFGGGALENGGMSLFSLSLAVLCFFSEYAPISMLQLKLEAYSHYKEHTGESRPGHPCHEQLGHTETAQSLPVP